jgi:hypothetical protein
VKEAINMSPQLISLRVVCEGHRGRVIGYEIDCGPAVTTSSHVNHTRDAGWLKIIRSHHFTGTRMYESCYI